MAFWVLGSPQRHTQDAGSELSFSSALLLVNFRRLGRSDITFPIVAREVLSIVILFSDIHYWYTHCSTVSISIVGTTLSAVSDIINKTVPVTVTAIAEKHTVPGWIRLFLFHMLTSLLVPLLMIKAVTRIELRWGRDTSWIPVLRAAPATHRERASKRKEAKFHWGAKMAVRYFIAAWCLQTLHPDRFPP